MSIEFTGERIVPGLVEDDLWNEHFARYAFALQFCRDRRVLDAACGAGYGARALAAEARTVIGLDVASEAISYSALNYPQPNLHWLQSSCTVLPLADAACDVVVAFEVIEHLREWRKLLAEAKRVLNDGGLFIVSTPSKNFYAETREHSGPNPFHEHEFEYQEFNDELASVFPHVRVVSQNHAACIVFDSQAGETLARLNARGQPSNAHFFVAVCSFQPVEVSSFIYVPESANLLQERASHILKLENELRLKEDWLSGAQHEHAQLVAAHTSQTEELRRSNEWAKGLDEQVNRLHREIESLGAAYQSLESDLAERTQWALSLQSQLSERADELARCVGLLDRAEATVVERTDWAQGLQRQLEAARTQIAMAQSSRWVKLGRLIKVGPELTG